MIEPILSLAMSMHSNPGVYALLLGSGVSRAAKIPTGWEVVLDLARRLALMEKEDSEPDPAAWYSAKYGEELDYSKLLHALAKSPSERQQLLRSYFEPSDEEREQGLKQPTPAHRSIAKLVASGHIRLILTTNFDKLLERAIADEGITPVVLSTADAIQGALPLAHQKCCVVKLHGDYLDIRIKNTIAELTQYDANVNLLLDQILDGFGLVVCGWSGQWDAALRAAIERCPSRRFTMYWAARGSPTELAQRMITQRGGEVIAIQDADSFFRRLAELVFALKDANRQHPSSVQAAVAMTKRFLAESRYRISLEELVRDTTEDAHAAIEEYNDVFLEKRPHVDEAFLRYRAILETLQQILICGVAYGARSEHALWVSALERIARYDKDTGTVLHERIWHYPIAYLWYSAGVAAAARGQWELLKVLLLDIRIRERRDTQSVLNGLEYDGLGESAKETKEGRGKIVPLSEHFFAVLRKSLTYFIPDQLDYEYTFDRFEILRALAFAHNEFPTIPAPSDMWAPKGRYCCKASRRTGDPILEKIRVEIKTGGANWAPLKAGMMGGSPERALELVSALEKFSARVCR